MQLSGERLGLAGRVLHGVADRSLRVVERVKGLRGVDHPTAGGQLHQAEALALPRQGRWRRAIHLEHESRASAHLVLPLRNGPLRADVEDDLDGTASAGRAGMGQGLLEAVEGVGRRDHLAGVQGAGHLDGEGKGDL